MLRSPKNSVLHLAPPSHADVFVEHYEQLKKWALRFTENDKDAAEDLLHDTFINLTLSKPDLTSIQNLEGYLFVVMRNLHLSHVRRATRLPMRSFSVIEYDTAEMPFWASDPREHLRMRDELAAVCRIACIRKESSKGGSLLILRFFHGYYPEEIGEIMRTSTMAVNARVNKVRAEIKLYLEEPERLRFIEDKLDVPIPVHTSYSGDDLRLQLRSYIFNSCQGTHITDEHLNALYISETVEFPIRQDLAHIVSCPKCIEKVNSLLGLAPLASRYPADMTGNDPGNKDDSGGGPGTGGSGGTKPMLDSYINRREAHYHHEPRELCVSVNGQFQGLQKIVAGKGELMLSIDTNETVGFVEVFSELGVRMLMLHVEPLPVGDGKQSAHVQLSSGRTIDASLNFGGLAPSLQVTYINPELAAISDAATAKAFEITVSPDVTAPTRPASEKDFHLRIEDSPFTNIKRFFVSLLRPIRLTAAFAALLIVSLIIFQFAPFTTVTAAELLEKSAAAEVAQLANKERVLHRTLDLEESRDGQIISRKRIDVWQSGERGITARRLYDENGRLAMGDWRSEKGVQTIYKRGEAAKLQPVPQNRTGSIGFEDAWQVSPSAGEFQWLLGSGNNAQLEEREGEYIITQQRTPESDGIIKASITLSKEDLHAIEQTFSLRVNNETRDYRMVEAAYEWRPANSVPPAVFEPNIELTGGVTAPTASTVSASPDANSNTAANTNVNAATVPSATLATASLEFEVVEALNNVGAFMGEQISVSRAPDGKISVTAMVETPSRKTALLTALANFRSNPAVRLQIETVAEVQERVSRQRSKEAKNVSPGTVERIEVEEGQNPVLTELKTRLSDEEARRFAGSMVARSRQARLHALAAKQIAERFSTDDLKSLTPAERTRWIVLVRGHVEKFLGELEALRRELGPFFPEASSAGSGGGSIGTDAEFQSDVRELFELSGTVQSGLDRSFALTAASGTPPVKTAAFWRSFANAASAGKSIIGYQP